MMKRVALAFRRVNGRWTDYAIAKPNQVVFVILIISVAICAGLWALVVPILSPDALAPYMHANVFLP